MRKPNWVTILARLAILVALGFFIYKFSGFGAKAPPVKDISIDELYKAIDAGQVSEMNLDGSSGEVAGVFTDHSRFKTRVADKERLEAAALAKNVKVTAQPIQESTGSMILNLVVWWLIVSIMIIATIWLLSRIFRGKGVQDEIKSFGSVQVNILKPQEKYSDVAGCDEAIVELREIVDCLTNPGRYEKFGVRTPRGILLAGPPGTGKTLLAKATAGEARIPLIPLSGSEFDEALVGIGASRIRSAFEAAKKLSPCIIFIDEFDAVGRRRTIGGFSGSGAYDQTLNQLLAEMDGFKSDKQVIVMAATNQPEILDPAVVRPGRFDRKVLVLLPDCKAREEIFKIHARKKPVDPKVDPKEVAKSTPSFSGADIEAMLNEAALLALRDRNKISITQTEIDEGIDKVVGGGKKKNSALSKDSLERIAYHEAGHTLATKLCPKSDPLRKVTILSMGMSGGSTWHKVDDNDPLKTDRYFKDRLIVLMGGRAAEQVRYSDVSIGASSDIDQATKLAKSMICDYGFSDKVGQVSHRQRSSFLGMASDSFNCSEETKRVIDSEVKQLIDDAYSQSLDLLSKNRRKLDAIAKALIERETLSNEEVDEIMTNLE